MFAEKMVAPDPPGAFLCPITQTIMKDPVQDKDGNTFERAAIVKWLREHGTSPITRHRMSESDLVPNRFLCEAIDAFVGHSGAGVAAGQAGRPRTPTPPLPVATDVGELEVEISASHFSPNDPVGATSQVLVSLKPPNGLRRTPVHIVCVVDVSGSMGSVANIQTTSGKLEVSGLSILDVVKHAVRTVIASLNENDTMVMVTFSNDACVCEGTNHTSPIRSMTEENKRLFNQFLDWMEPHGNTNLWAGLKLGLDFLTDGISVHRHNALFLFTDGEPTIVPPRGFIPMLTQYKEKHGIKGVINTFGFGYDLDSHLLRDLAREGGGTYSFIPDASFVGTIFIHSTANLLSTYASSVSVRIEPMYAAVLDRDIPGGHLAQWTSNVMDLDLGTMRYDQPKDLALLLHRVPPKNTPYVRVTVTYKTILSEQIHSLAVEGITWEAQSSDLDYHLNRLHFVDVLNSVLSHSPHQPAKRKIPAKLAAKAKARPAAAPATPADSTQQDLNAVLSEGIAALADLAEEIRESGVTEPRVVALLADIEGQGTLALRLEYYQRWGRHYLPSLASAHFHQFCNNFKDPGVQVYARGQLFSTLRDSIRPSAAACLPGR